MIPWTARTTLLAAVLAVCGVFAIWWTWPAPSIPAGATVIAAPAKEVKSEIPTAAPAPKVIYVYRDAVKAKLKLPETVLDDARQQVVASSKVKEDERPHTVTTTVDLDTGKFTTFDRSDPLPWFATSLRGEVGLAYGLRNGKTIGRVYAQQDIAQIKAVHVGAMATLDTDGQWFAGVRAGYRW
jgi:hypothetical protein